MAAPPRRQGVLLRQRVMVLTDLTIALPLLCQGLAETYGSGHVRPARAGIAADLRLAPLRRVP
jgi:hypothetical protein